MYLLCSRVYKDSVLSLGSTGGHLRGNMSVALLLEHLLHGWEMPVRATPN